VFESLSRWPSPGRGSCVCAIRTWLDGESEVSYVTFVLAREYDVHCW
jgi:hypothetical protein